MINMQNENIHELFITEGAVKASSLLRDKFLY